MLGLEDYSLRHERKAPPPPSKTTWSAPHTFAPFFASDKQQNGVYPGINNPAFRDNRLLPVTEFPASANRISASCGDTRHPPHIRLAASAQTATSTTLVRCRRAEITRGEGIEAYRDGRTAQCGGLGMIRLDCATWNAYWLFMCFRLSQDAYMQILDGYKSTLCFIDFNKKKINK